MKEQIYAPYAKLRTLEAECLTRQEQNIVNTMLIPKTISMFQKNEAPKTEVASLFQNPIKQTSPKF